MSKSFNIKKLLSSSVLTSVLIGISIILFAYIAKGLKDLDVPKWVLFIYCFLYLLLWVPVLVKLEVGAPTIMSRAIEKDQSIYLTDKSLKAIYEEVEAYCKKHDFPFSPETKMKTAKKLYKKYGG
jgi:hypothetical protein